MRIEQIIKLATEAAEGCDNLKEGAVGSNGYGFVFKDFDTHQNEPFIVPYGSSKFCGAGTHRNFIKNLRIYKNLDVVSDLFRYDIVKNEYSNILERIEDHTIRAFASILKNEKSYPTLGVEAYKLVNSNWKKL